MKWLRIIFFIVLTIFGGLTASAQSLSEKGVGKWYSLPFADVRLLSCTTGTLDRNLLVGGLQIKIHPGWVLKKPQLKPLSKYAVLDYPIRPDPINTTQYTGNILLPIIYDATAQKETQFGIEGFLMGCWDDDCLNLPIQMNLPLDNQESDYTPYCAYIMEEMLQTPKLDFHIGSGQYIDEHSAILRFHIPSVYQAFLQNQNDFHFKILKTQIWSDMVQWTVTYPENWPKGTLQDWIVITNQGIFRAPIRLSEKPLPPVLQTRPWGMFFIIGFLLFVCSPFFILWGTAFPKTIKQLRRQCVLAAMTSALLMIGTCLKMKYFPDFSLETQYVLIIMGLTLVFFPHFFWWAGLLFIVWPKPYLKSMIDYFSLWYLIPWIILWQIIPFGILYHYGEFWIKKAHKSLKKAPFSHYFFFLLPTIVMLTYGIYHFYLDVPYRPNLDLKMPTLVCEKEDCIGWEKNGFNVHFIDTETPVGKSLLKLYQAKKNVFIFNDSGISTILSDTTPEKLKKYLFGLQNYRAGYRQAHPPVHSGGDQRVLLPNAN